MQLEPGDCKQFQKGQETMIIVETTDQGAADFTIQQSGGQPQQHHLEIDSQFDQQVQHWPVTVCNLASSDGPILVAED